MKELKHRASDALHAKVVACSKATGISMDRIVGEGAASEVHRLTRLHREALLRKQERERFWHAEGTTDETQ